MKKETLSIKTSSKTHFVAISNMIKNLLREWEVQHGVCTLYVPHTTAAVFVNEGYDPDVMRDLEYSLNQQVPWNDPNYAHAEGNTAAHVKAILTGNSQQLIVENGHLLLGQWEEIFFAEYDGPRSRRIHVTFIEG